MKLAQPYKHKDLKTHIEIFPCKTFPQGAIIVNAVGHICELANPAEYKKEWGGRWSVEQLPIVPEEHKFILKVTPSKRKVFNLISKYIKDSTISTVVHCGDIAREGELLIMEILLLAGNKKPVKRLWTSSLTPTAVKKAFDNLKDQKDTMPLYYEALARQRADWIMGINFSRLTTVLLEQKGIQSNSGGFPVGRVMTSILGIIYKREMEIRNFVSRPYWDVLAEFSLGEQSFIGKWYKPGADHIFNEEQAAVLADICKDNEAVIYSVEKKKEENQPPQFYNLTQLQLEGNKRLGLSAAEILEIAQSLYLKGLITYPASPVHITREEAKLFPTILSNLSKIPEYNPLLPVPIDDISSNKRYVDESKTDDHFALLVTEEPVNFEQLTDHEKVIYDMIARSVIAAHYPNAVYDKTEIISVIEDKFSFKTKGKQLVEPGWKVVFQTEGTQENQPEMALPSLEEGDLVKVRTVDIEQGITAPKARLNQGSLVKVMENASAFIEKDEKQGLSKSDLSLGTVATRADIIKKLLEKKYISVKKNEVYIEPKGQILIKALGENSYLTSPVTTGNMEKYLEMVGKGKKDYKPFVQRTIDVTKEYIEKIKEDSKNWDFTEIMEQFQKEETVGPCIECKEPIVDKGNFYGCTGYNSSGCSFSLPKEKSGKKLSQHHITSILEKGTTPLIKGFKKRNKDDTFDAFLVWNKEEKRLKFNFEGVPPKSKK
ncbi:DNA topoisomerase [Aquibacillus sp. 3ASR75-11]|uniref:DNA topoisomerase n=2 Tax=Terrihalobacillus insolitus TaxID=2950438 RepID=A0A9X3WQT8_9BACI|nr:DNA topoisomerase [Terrihalobacillus insolitus]